MIMQCIFAFCAIISFSVINEAPKKCLFINGVLGMAGWAVYLYLTLFDMFLQYFLNKLQANCNNQSVCGLFFTIFFIATTNASTRKIAIAIAPAAPIVYTRLDNAPSMSDRNRL